MDTADDNSCQLLTAECDAKTQPQLRDKPAQDYLKRFFLNSDSTTAEKNGRKVKTVEAYCSLCITALQPNGYLIKATDNFTSFKRHVDTKHKSSKVRIL